MPSTMNKATMKAIWAVCQSITRRLDGAALLPNNEAGGYERSRSRSSRSAAWMP